MNSNKIESAVQATSDHISDSMAPAVMTLEEAEAYLEEVLSTIQTALGGIRADLTGRH